MTSADFLYTIAATCIIVFTVFASLALYHFIIILKRVRGLCEAIEERTDRFFHVCDDVRAKITGFKTTLDMIATTVRAFVYASQKVTTKHSKKKNYHKDDISAAT